MDSPLTSQYPGKVGKFGEGGCSRQERPSRVCLLSCFMVISLSVAWLQVDAAAAEDHTGQVFIIDLLVVIIMTMWGGWCIHC